MSKYIQIHNYLMEKLTYETTEIQREILLILTILESGCRVSEAVNLNWKNFCNVTFNFKIRGKGRKVRLIEISEDVHMKLVVTSRMTAGRQSPVFRNILNKPVTRNKVQEYLSKHLHSKFGHITPHDLRRFYAAYNFENGMELGKILKNLGHSHESTTAIYTKAKINGGISESHPSIQFYE
jgi:integrase/recombinase XerC